MCYEATSFSHFDVHREHVQIPAVRCTILSSHIWNGVMDFATAFLLGSPRVTSNIWYCGPSTEAQAIKSLQEPFMWLEGHTQRGHPLPVVPTSLSVYCNPRGVTKKVHERNWWRSSPVRPYLRQFHWRPRVISRRGKSHSLDRLRMGFSRVHALRDERLQNGLPIAQ